MILDIGTVVTAYIVTSNDAIFLLNIFRSVSNESCWIDRPEGGRNYTMQPCIVFHN